MKYAAIFVVSILLGYFLGLQHAYYRARQFKEELKEAIVTKVEDKYENMKQKIYDRISTKKDEAKNETATVE